MTSAGMLSSLKSMWRRGEHFVRRYADRHREFCLADTGKVERVENGLGVRGYSNAMRAGKDTHCLSKVTECFDRPVGTVTYKP
jgi:hypothetical protein